MFSKGDGVEYWGTRGRLEMSWCTRWRMRVERGWEEFLGRVSLLGCADGYSVGDGGGDVTLYMMGI